MVILLEEQPQLLNLLCKEHNPSKSGMLTQAKQAQRSHWLIHRSSMNIQHNSLDSWIFQSKRDAHLPSLLSSRILGGRGTQKAAGQGVLPWSLLNLEKGFLQGRFY